MKLVFTFHIYETHVCSMYKRCFVKSVEQTFAYLFRWHMWKIRRDYFIEHHIRCTVLINGRHSALGTDLPYLATASLFFKLNILHVQIPRFFSGMRIRKYTEKGTWQNDGRLFVHVAFVASDKVIRCYGWKYEILSEHIDTHIVNKKRYPCFCLCNTFDVPMS